jgi:uncharacterized protein YdeI (YjbR/CyaY-like superfamily)
MVIMMIPLRSHPLAAAFFKPLLDLSVPRHLTRDCPGLSDQDYLRLGLLRTLGAETTGRAFLDTLQATFPQTPARSSFFDAIASSRRLKHLQATNEALVRTMTRTLDDPFAAFPELAPYQLFAGDGHWHAAATHDPRDSKGTKHATGHVYLQNLRTQALRHLDLCDPIHKRKEHDISVIKRATLDALRGNTPKGTPVILVWDRAIIDYRFLQKVKDQAGLYFITRPKSNSNLTRSGLNDIAPIPANEGVISDELVAPVSTARCIRRITWQDPDSGEAWQYLTNEMKLPPGLIVLLYRRRWDLEKVYDQFKNKLNEKKSWASSVTAKAAQAVFLCLLHNLMVLFEAGLADSGITNQAEEKRRQKVLTERTERVEKTGRKMPLIIAGFQRLTQRTLKFIRWLRSFFWQKRPLDELRLILKKRYAAL